MFKSKKNIITISIIAVLVIGAVIVFTRFRNEETDSSNGHGGVVTAFNNQGQVAGAETYDSSYLNPIVFQVPEYFRELEAKIAEPVEGQLASYELAKDQLQIKLTIPSLSSSNNNVIPANNNVIPAQAGNQDSGFPTRSDTVGTLGNDKESTGMTKEESLIIKYVKAAPETPAINNNKVVYTEAYLGADFDYRLYDGLTRQMITLNHVNAAQEFTFKLDVSSGLTIGEMTGGYLPIYKVQTPFREGTLAEAGEKEEMFILKVPQGIGVNGARVDYEYEKIDGQTYILKPSRSGQLSQAMYPIKIDASILAVSWDEALVKVGENGREAGNAKDGDVAAVKPAGWNWGVEERKRFVIVRVPKYSASQRQSFTESNEQGSYTFGLDYTKLATKQQLEQIRNPLLPSPVLDATRRPDVIKPKPNALGSIIPDELRLAYAEPKQGLAKCSVIPESSDGVGTSRGSSNSVSWIPAFAGMTEKIAGMIRETTGLPRLLRSLTMTQIDKIGCYTEVLAQKIFQPAQAVTIITSSIGTASRDYSTMQLWEDAVDGNLVTAGVIQKGEAYADSDFGARITIDGSTTDSTHFIWLTVPLDERHEGIEGTGVVISAATNLLIAPYDNGTLVEWLEISCTAATSRATNVVTVSATSVHLKNLIIHDCSTTSGDLYGINETSGDAYVANSIVYDFTNSGSLAQTGGISATKAYNNTVYNMQSSAGSGWGIYLEQDAGDYEIVNNIAVDNDDMDFFDGTVFEFSILTENNISSDATSPNGGLYRHQSSNDLFISPADRNFHLKQGAFAVDGGTNVSSTFNTDIDGQIRQGNWDVGADELPCAGDWWHCNWNKRRKITLDNSAQSSSHTDFPAAVQLNSTRIDFNNASTSDIRFVDADNATLLQHEIEKWDETGTTTLWVKVPSIDTTGSDYIWMYYSNGSATSTATTTGVWDDNFVGVWHLGESTGGSGAIIDSSNAGNNGTDNNSPTFGVTGITGSAIYFDGVDQFIDVAESATLRGMANLTLSAWVDDSYSDDIKIFGKWSIAEQYYILREVSGNIQFYTFTSGQLGGNTGLTGSAGWHYYTATYDGATMVAYKDTVAGGTTFSPTGSINSDVGDSNLILGAEYDQSNPGEQIVDEMRISDTHRSTDWMDFEYCNMLDTCNSYGPEEQQQIPVGLKYR